MKQNRTKYITKTTVKKTYGFSEKMIKDLLPPPINKTNPHYRCGAPMQLWDESEVIRVTKTKKFLAAAEKHQKRSEIAQRAAATKFSKNLAEAKSLMAEFKFHRIKPKKLRAHAIAYKRDRCAYRGEFFDISYCSSETIDRWMRNYARHNLTNYDELYSRFKRKVGSHEIHDYIKDLVMEEIYKEYPFLREDAEPEEQEPCNVS